ncbi:small ribosomal subunit protein uS3m [Pezoporus occidentalis]|uniref:small ribosomal subunit protein uS3m n=1 Tax=Pezoporus occidentalis TaxID=407982 RepID=UPI002F906EA7
MAAPAVVRALRALPHIRPVPDGTRHLHSTPPCLKARAGRVRVGKGDKAVTYEQAHGPHHIGHRKGWLSLHTGNLCSEGGAAERALEDAFARRFLRGTFPGALLAPPLLRRRGRALVVSAVVARALPAPQLLFLQGWAEALLSGLYRSPVRIELLALPAPPVYKHI